MTDPAAGTSVGISIKKTVLLPYNGAVRTIDIADPAAHAAVLVPNGPRSNAVARLKRFGSACLYSYAPYCFVGYFSLGFQNLLLSHPHLCTPECSWLLSVVQQAR